MRIFLTGATGYIGSAVLDALVRQGHTVTALVRDNEKAARVAARGAQPVVGNLAEPASYRGAIDVGIGILSMHSPMDVSAKVDVWELSRGFKAFFDTAPGTPPERSTQSSQRTQRN